jgi:hypothetical protein
MKTRRFVSAAAMPQPLKAVVIGVTPAFKAAD